MSDFIINLSNLICGYPLFVWLIGGGLFLFCYSRAVPVRRLGAAVRSLRTRNSGEGQISSFQALMSAISATVGMGNIAGVAIALVVGGPGAIFWMWVSALMEWPPSSLKERLQLCTKAAMTRAKCVAGLCML